ncbi:MAG: hypothetical protein ACOVOV_01580 [Dolichospermum sp.]
MKSINKIKKFRRKALNNIADIDDAEFKDEMEIFEKIFFAIIFLFNCYLVNNPKLKFKKEIAKTLAISLNKFVEKNF